MSKVHDLRGKVFGKLIAMRATKERRRGQILWQCLCECGVVKSIASYYLVSGRVVSCGCHGKSILGNNTRIHGRTGTVEYVAWKLMRQRCTNRNHPKFRIYGARGISVCGRWDEFNNFLYDMGPKPHPKYSIDRIDVNGNYEPGNCRWADAKTQANNKRRVSK